MRNASVIEHKYRALIVIGTVLTWFVPQPFHVTCEKARAGSDGDTENFRKHVVIRL